MRWFEMLTMAMSLAVRLVPVAEETFSDKPKSGARKTAMIMTCTKALVDTMGAVSTGGQAETWQRLETPIGEAVNAACAVMYPKEKPND